MSVEDWREMQYEQVLRMTNKMLEQQGEITALKRDLVVANAEVARLKRLLGKDDAAVDPNILPESGAPIFLNPEKVTEAVEAQATEWRERQKLDPDPRPHHLRVDEAYAAAPHTFDEESDQIRADADATSERDGL